LLSFGHNPNNGLVGKLDLIAILRTCDQRLNAHFHLRCLIPGAASRENASHWRPCQNRYLFDEKALGLALQGKFMDSMTQAHQKGQLTFAGITAPHQKPEKFPEINSYDTDTNSPGV
jgi:hypothetical protein